MRLFTEESRHNIFWRFLVSYLIILLIPQITGFFIYRETTHRVEEDIKKTNLSILQQSRDIVDMHLKDVDTMVNQLAFNSKVLNFLNMKELEDGTSDIYKVLDLKNDLAAYRITNNFIKEFYIYSRTNNIILSTYTAYTRERFFYGPFLEYNHLSLDEWHERIIDQYHKKDYLPAAPVTLSGKKYSVITYMQSLPLEYGKSFQGTVLVLIDESAIQKLLKEVNIGSGGWFYIADESGRFITSFSDTGREIAAVELDGKGPEGQLLQKLDGKDTLVSYTTSPLNKWKYVAVVPARYALNKADYIKKINFAVTLCTLLAGLIIASFLSYRNVKPLRDIVENVRISIGGETAKGISEYDFLKGTISNLIYNNQNLQGALEGQTPLLRAAFFRRLLDGSFKDIAEVRTILSHINLNIYGEKYLVMILKIHGHEGLVSGEILKELDAARILVKDILEKQSESPLYTVDLDENKICILMTFPKVEDEKCKIQVTALVAHLRNILYSNFNIRVLFATGDFYNSILDTRFSYEQAGQALEYKPDDKDCGLIWYSDIPAEGTRFYYPMEVESRLINCLKTGETEEVKKILRDIYQENLVRRHIAPDMKQQLILSLKTTIVRFFEKVKREDNNMKVLLEGINYNGNLEGVYKYMSNIFISICDKINQHKNNQDDELYRNITDFIQEVYMQESLCLYNVANKFGLTEAYLYQFFKNKAGSSFTCYLEGVRMQKAKELLLQTELPIQEISEQVGYSSHYSFRRAFKRYEGVLPTEYREDLRNGSQT